MARRNAIDIDRCRDHLKRRGIIARLARKRIGHKDLLGRIAGASNTPKPGLQGGANCSFTWNAAALSTWRCARSFHHLLTATFCVLLATSGGMSAHGIDDA
ncbi:hypothetical protein [Xanthomonas fragariae]|uniref:hypothetical protein n=1 Tax=Xanthomonas fragariae TaxID=48664 RepID=UPI001ABEC652|nr:hypothetical protein [Xanthomonas fragariae]UKR52821.1 hypothetical protein K4A87_01470 [Xanthomonas fragariae]